MSIPLFFIFSPNTGEILRSIFCDPTTAELQTLPGESIIIAAPNTSASDHYIDTASLTQVQIPARPSEAHNWDWPTKQWGYDLAQGRAQVWSRIKAARESMEFGKFVWGAHTFDGDSESQRRIQGAAQLATLAQATGQPFSIDWTLADNTQVTMTAGEMIGVGVALGQHVNGAHGIARTLRTQIDAATTPEELEAIQWPT